MMTTRRMRVIWLLLLVAAMICGLLSLAAIRRTRDIKKAAEAARLTWMFIEGWASPHAERPYPLTHNAGRIWGSGSRDFSEWLADEDHHGLPSNAPPYQASSTSFLNWLTSQNVLQWSSDGLDQDRFRSRLLLFPSCITNVAITADNNPWCVVAVPADSQRSSARPVMFTRNIGLTTRHLREQKPERILIDRTGHMPAVLLTRGGDVRIISENSVLSGDEFGVPTNLARSVEVWDPKGIRW